MELNMWPYKCLNSKIILRSIFCPKTLSFGRVWGGGGGGGGGS